MEIRPKYEAGEVITRDFNQKAIDLKLKRMEFLDQEFEEEVINYRKNFRSKKKKHLMMKSGKRTSKNDRNSESGS